MNNLYDDQLNSAALSKIIVNKSESKRTHASGGFKIAILFPGTTMRHGDSGLGTIGRIDDASVSPGTLIGMHPHKDDEILTYLRGGRVLHKDTVGNEEWITPNRLMLMGAGKTFQHEELVDPKGETLRALQIFLRPESADLEPEVQFHDFGKPQSFGEWRRIAGPSTEDPLRVRSKTTVDDAFFTKGTQVALPSQASNDDLRLLYVFSGAIILENERLMAGDSATLAQSATSLQVLNDAELVLLTTDMAAPTFKGGMFSGNNVKRQLH